jgi:hypothetical protein
MDKSKKSGKKIVNHEEHEEHEAREEELLVREEKKFRSQNANGKS